ncbi:MAG: hypothetical protein ACM3VV_01160 [Deltaproteobacteria bacterium]
MSDKNENFNDIYNNSNQSVILTTRFGITSAKLIHSVEKNLYVVMAIIISISVLSILNVTGILDYFYSEDVDYQVDVILSIILILLLAPLISLVIKSRKVLDKWNDMFEENTITTSMKIMMANRSKEEALKAVVLSIGQMTEPFKEYRESTKSDLKEFLDVSIDKNTIFDVAMIADKLPSNSSRLKEVLEEFGMIFIKIVDGTADKKTVEDLIKSLRIYVSNTGNNIGLGVLIGEETSDDAHRLVNQINNNKRDKIDQIILMSKPLLNSQEQFPTNFT